jgi:hypothetical protein
MITIGQKELEEIFIMENKQPSQDGCHGLRGKVALSL